MAAIRNLVFDIGRVLVDFSYDSFQTFLVTHGGTFSSKEDFIEKTNLLHYEAGLISTDSFLDNVLSQLSGSPSREELIAQWTDIFRPNEPMLTALDSLATQYPVYLLSNTNELHWQFLASEFGLGTRTRGVMTSYEAGTMKPHPEIFKQTAARFALEPEVTLFIDDVPEHVTAAKQLGWQGIWHESTEKTLSQLAELGINC